MSSDGKRIKWLRNIAENFNCLSKVHERYRQTDDRQTDRQTDVRTTTYSEREPEFARNGPRVRGIRPVALPNNIESCFNYYGDIVHRNAHWWSIVAYFHDFAISRVFLVLSRMPLQVLKHNFITQRRVP